MVKYKGTFNLGKRILKVRFSATMFDESKITIGMNSGRPFTGLHTLFLDFDKINPVKEMKKIMEDYYLSKVYVVESSPKKYHAICFDEIPFGRMLEITARTKSDKWHRMCTLFEGQSTLRTRSRKGNKSYPRVVEILESSTNCWKYNKTQEKAYLLALESNKAEGNGRR